MKPGWIITRSLSFVRSRRTLIQRRIGLSSAESNPRCFDWSSVIAIRCVGGRSSVNPRSQPWNMGLDCLQWTGVIYLHHGAAYRAWSNILKVGIIPGYNDNTQRDKKDQEEPRTEAFYSSSTYMKVAQLNAHTFVTPHKFNHRKNEVDI
eukprot:5703372-Pyramimonas_sp.AAC.1